MEESSVVDMLSMRHMLSSFLGHGNNRHCKSKSLEKNFKSFDTVWRPLLRRSQRTGCSGWLGPGNTASAIELIECHRTAKLNGPFEE